LKKFTKDVLAENTLSTVFRVRQSCELPEMAGRNQLQGMAEITRLLQWTGDKRDGWAL